MRKKLTKLDIVGRWTIHEGKIVKYTNIQGDTRCSYCNGTNENCPICKGHSIVKPPRWYQIFKIIKNISNNTSL